MPTVLRLRFPACRFHATPWGHHVNEGQVEWPPAPWRILRALLATGFLKLGWPAEGPPDAARRLVHRLAGLLPSYSLPSGSLGHSRHYVDADGKKPLIFDTFLHLADKVLEVVWDVELPGEERSLLTQLAHLLGYLGRAESWVEAELRDRAESPTNCEPARAGTLPAGCELLRLRCAVSAEAYDEWRAGRAAVVEADYAPGPGKRRTAAQQKKLEAALLPYPVDLLAALCAETSVLQSQGWTEPPGSREVLYVRRSDVLVVGVGTASRAVAVSPTPLALLALSTASRETSALPPVSRTFAQGRLLHRALASVIGKQMGGDAQLALCLLGRDRDEKARGPHRHAHLLHLDLDGDGRLDHALIYAPMGLDQRAQEALGRLRRTYMKGGVGELQVALAGVGDREMLRQLGAGMGTAVARVLGPKQGARMWISETPYVAPRLLKRRGKDSLEALVRSDCQRRGLPALLKIEILSRDEALSSVRHMRDHVLHDAQHEPPRRVPFALRLQFVGPVHGPICLGYGAHAGLGRFVVDGRPEGQADQDGTPPMLAGLGRVVASGGLEAE